MSVDEGNGELAEEGTGEVVDDVVTFCLHWGLNDDAEAKVVSLAPEVQQEVIRNFKPNGVNPGDEVNGKLISFASSIEKRYREGTMRTNGQNPMAPEVAENIDAFIEKWALNENAVDKLMRLSPAIQQLVMQGFAPPDTMTEVNGKFIMYAASIDRAHQGKGKGKDQGFYYKPHFPQVPTHQQTWQHPPQQAHQSIAGGKGRGPSNDDCLAFAQHWGLNGDATQKLFTLDSAVRQLVMHEFSPSIYSPEHAEVSGKFIAFANSVSKKGAGKGEGPLEARAPGRGGGAGNSWGGSGTWGGGGGDDWTRSSGAWSGGANDWSGIDAGTLKGFCQHWKLNEDAQNKLFKLTPEAQKIVIDQFNPPAGATECSGKFIMFAASIEKSKGGKGCKGKGKVQYDPLSAFVQRWGLNADAQAKLYKLRPDVQEAVIHSFSPPPHLPEVSGKFIMFAASIERGGPKAMPKGEKGFHKGFQWGDPRGEKRTFDQMRM